MEWYNYRIKELKYHMRWHIRGKVHEYTNVMYDYEDSSIDWTNNDQPSNKICNICVKTEEKCDCDGRETSLACRKCNEIKEEVPEWFQLFWKILKKVEGSITDFNNVTIDKVR